MPQCISPPDHEADVAIGLKSALEGGTGAAKDYFLLEYCDGELRHICELYINVRCIWSVLCIGGVGYS